MTSLAGLVLLLLVPTAAIGKTFQRLQTNLSLHDRDITSVLAPSLHVCALSGYNQSLGIMYHQKSKRCHLYLCLNPGVYQELNHSDVFLQTNLTANKLPSKRLVLMLILTSILLQHDQF